MIQPKWNIFGWHYSAKCLRIPRNFEIMQASQGDYRCVSVGTGHQKTQHFVYHDRKLVSFITNVFLPSMDAKIVVLQSDGILVQKSVPPLLPAYNKYMGV